MTVVKCFSFNEFAIKRAIRLYPAYIISVILTFITTTTFNLEPLTVGIKDFIFNLTMLQSVIPGTGIKLVDAAY